MRVKSESQYALVMTVTFNDIDAATEFEGELLANPNVYGVAKSGRGVKYHTFSAALSSSLAKDFESKWIARMEMASDTSVEMPSIEASQPKGMIRYGNVEETDES